MISESKARKPNKDALRKGHTGSRTDRNVFFFLSHSKQKTRAGASTLAPAPDFLLQ